MLSTSKILLSLFDILFHLINVERLIHFILLIPNDRNNQILEKKGL